MPTLSATTYDLSANRFFFDNIEEFNKGKAFHVNSYGQSVADYEVEFIDGEALDAELFKAYDAQHVCNLEAFFEAAQTLDDHDKIKTIILVVEVGYAIKGLNLNNIDVYKCNTMKDFAKQLVAEGWFDDIPKRFENYIDYDALARDLSVDYGETCIGGVNYIYRAD
jgi:Antirestriction protein (ArdA)